VRVHTRRPACVTAGNPWGPPTSSATWRLPQGRKLCSSRGSQRSPPALVHAAPPVERCSPRCGQLGVRIWPFPLSSSILCPSQAYLHVVSNACGLPGSICAGRQPVWCSGPAVSCTPCCSVRPAPLWCKDMGHKLHHQPVVQQVDALIRSSDSKSARQGCIAEEGCKQTGQHGRFMWKDLQEACVLLEEEAGPFIGTT